VYLHELRNQEARTGGATADDQGDEDRESSLGFIPDFIPAGAIDFETHTCLRFLRLGGSRFGSW